MHEQDKVFVGIDVSKAHLDVAVHGEAELRRVANDEAGIESLVFELAALKPTLTRTAIVWSWCVRVPVGSASCIS